MEILKNVEMKQYSNMKIGGIANELIFIEDKKELCNIFQDGKEYFVLGNGTNTLITDKPINKSFISLLRLKKIDELERGLVRAEVGINFDDLVEYTREHNYAGLEDLAGIPGSLGGLVFMNGGSFGSEIFDNIIEIEILDENKNIKTIKKSELKFSYRKTEIQENDWIIISATFKFADGFNAERVAEVRGKRKENHPLSMPNLGSTFKNPEGYYSARLIIEASMQGEKVGDAQISMVHPNFIVNHGNATLDDVIKLIDKVKTNVKNKTGISIEEEIRVVK